MALSSDTWGRERRIVGLAVILAAAGLFLVGRIAWWQLFPHSELESSDLILPNTIPAVRGNIMDANGQYLVASTVEYKLGVSPRLMSQDEKEALAPVLAEILGQQTEKVLEVLEREGTEYEVLGAMLGPEIGARLSELWQLEDLRMDAFRLDASFSRVYPDGNLASHVLGFVQPEETGEFAHPERGQYGLEEYYDTMLRGEEGTWRGLTDSWGEQLFVSLGGYQPAQDGVDLKLTLDRNIQYAAERILTEGITDTKAASGTLIVLEPRTGAVLAMAGWPDYEPKVFWDEESGEVYINSAVTSLYEPGSVFKVLTLAAALEARVIRPDDTYDDRGQIIVGNQKIMNSDRMAHGTTTMTEILTYSRNVGAAHVAMLLGATRFYEAMRRFGIGQVTAVDLAGETAGIMRVPSDPYWHISDLGTNSYGQGVAIPPIQVAAAFAAIANDGVLMRPYIVAEVQRGDEVDTREPFYVRQAVSEDIAHQMSEMMVTAVNNGMQKAMVSEYRIAGKSGTSEIPDQEGYRDREIIASFVGFGPVPDPRFVVLVKYEEPQEGYWGIDVAAPAFSEMAKFLLDYYGIPPNGS